jgi:hypothetical protein
MNIYIIIIGVIACIVGYLLGNTLYNMYSSFISKLLNNIGVAITTIFSYII